MTKFTVAFERKVRTGPYETIGVNLGAEYDSDEVSWDQGFEEVKNAVNKWIETERDRIIDNQTWKLNRG